MKRIMIWLLVFALTVGCLSACEDNKNLRDSDAQANIDLRDSNTQENQKPQNLYTAKVGDYIVLGSYEQDNDTSNGKENIEWLVLAREGDKLLLISRYALDNQPYNTSDTGVTWENCSLRTWLNGTFINNAFSSDEKELIQSTTVTADKNPSYSTSPGNNTTDNVFLLSIAEVNKFFSSNSARQCQATVYAMAQGVSAYYHAICHWWLRSPGLDSDRAVCVGGDGSLILPGPSVTNAYNAVRPALWIDIGT